MSGIVLQITSPRALTAEVDPYQLGAPLVCDYEYDEGEYPVFWPTERSHPGSPSNIQLLACRIGGVDVFPMLSNDQVERIEESLLELHE